MSRSTFRNQLTKTIVALSVPLLLTVGFAQANSAAGDTALLNSGQVTVSQNNVGSGVPSVVASVLLDHPPAKVWPVVANPALLMQNEAKVKKAVITSKSANAQTVAFTVSMARLLPAFNYVLQENLSPPNQMTFHRISGSFKDIQGSWKLTPTAGGQKTILTYTLQLDPGPLVPKGMLLGAVKSDLPTMMKNVRVSIDHNVK